MKIEILGIEKLRPFVANARTHSEWQIEQICASIREFGFTNPVLIDGNDGIIAGHGRVMAAGKMGMENVPCIRLGHLSEAQRRAYVIADNKLALNAGWDETLLAAELAAFFSKARHSSKAPVIYTLKKYVRKPRGAKAGLAMCQREKSIMVLPKDPAEGREPE